MKVAAIQREIAIAWRLNPLQKEIDCSDILNAACEKDPLLTARGYRSGWLHRQRIVKAIEIVKQPYSGQQLDNLAFVKVMAQFAKELVIDGVRVMGHAFRQAQRGLFFVREIRALFEVSQIVDLVVCPAVPSCQDGV